MFEPDSVLRNLPCGLDRKQALFFDGLRHAAEIADFSYGRLQQTLAVIATETHDQTERCPLFTAAFIDAWAIVDSIDRFRSLWKLLPANKHPPPDESVPTFASLTQAIRNLRNVADHLAQRADYVLANNGSALGELSWVTITDTEKPEPLCCAILPGTIQRRRTQLPLPTGKVVDIPSGLINLRAGEYEACLSDTIPNVRAIVRHIEKVLDAEFRLKGVRNECASSDILLIGNLELAWSE